VRIISLIPGLDIFPVFINITNIKSNYLCSESGLELGLLIINRNLLTSKSTIGKEQKI